jgi:hypothetical protein
LGLPLTLLDQEIARGTQDFFTPYTWLSLENAIILIDRQGGQIQSSGTEADPHQ